MLQQEIWFKPRKKKCSAHDLNKNAKDEKEKQVNGFKDKSYT